MPLPPTPGVLSLCVLPFLSFLSCFSFLLACLLACLLSSDQSDREQALEDIKTGMCLCLPTWLLYRPGCVNLIALEIYNDCVLVRNSIVFHTAVVFKTHALVLKLLCTIM